MTHAKQPTDEWMQWAAETEGDGIASVGGLKVRIAALECREHRVELAAVGQLLDLRRRELGLEIDELAKRAHVAPESLNDLERGLVMPNSADVIRLVARALNLPGDKLVEAASIDGATDPILSRAALRCADRAKSPNRLYPGEREALTEFIGILSGR